MAAKEQANRKKTEKAGGSGQLRILAIVIVAVLVISAIIGYMLNHGATGSGSETIGEFQQQYLTAQRVGLYVADPNSLSYSYAQTCADAIIYAIIANRQYHRNASTIDLYIVNLTTCTEQDGLGPSAQNSIKTTPAACQSAAAHEPTISINYSTQNVTVIKSNYLYTSGNKLFLEDCGIASELG